MQIPIKQRILNHALNYPSGKRFTSNSVVKSISGNAVSTGRVANVLKSEPNEFEYIYDKSTHVGEWVRR